MSNCLDLICFVHIKLDLETGSRFDQETKNKESQQMIELRLVQLMQLKVTAA